MPTNFDTMIEASPRQNIVFNWLSWHFKGAVKEIFRGWKNFLVFNFNYFSISQLLKTLFSHWRRYRDSYGRGFDPKRYASVFLSNLISRVLGALVRLVVIIVGVIAEVFIFAAGLVVLLVWLFLPLALLFAITAAIGLLV